MKFIKKPYVFAVIYSLVLALAATFTMLDTLVISRKYSDVSTDSNGSFYDSVTGVTGITVEQPDTEIPEEERYFDDSISIFITEYRVCDTNVYVADVRLSGIQFFRSAFARSAYGKNITETVSEMAESNGAILAINGDYYGVHNKGYVIRNGVVYRDWAYSYEREDLVVYSDGSFGTAVEGMTSTSSLIKAGALQVYSFGPVIVRGGEVSVDGDDEVKHSMESNPRTAIGIIEPLHYLFVVSDGRTEESAGLSLYELGSFMKELGAELAYNLDGGGSSTMYFKGRVVNVPTSGFTEGERKVSDIVYIGK